MLPLDGLNDYIDITAIVNPWQALVVCLLVFALLIWPQLSARQTVRRIETTLTTNNGGSTVKDQMDRLEKKLGEHIEWSEGYVKDTSERLDALEESRERRGLLRGRRVKP